MPLHLTRPLAFIDLETTGINVASDRIVEYSVIKVFPDKTQAIKTQRINPTIPIPYPASAVHGIFDKDVVDCPTFKDIAKDLSNFIEGCDLAGYNSNKFDLPLLAEEFLRADVDFDLKNRKLVDVQTIFHKMEQRTLTAAYKFYCNKTLEKAHSAEADILATYEILEAQTERYGELIKNDVDSLHEFTNGSKIADLAGRIGINDKGIEVFNFGKHIGKSVEDVFKVEPSYYDWMMKGDFPLFTKKVITQIRLRGFNKKN